MSAATTALRRQGLQPGAVGIEVLLITSRETRRWVVPKGWPMKKKTPSEAAAQEAWEEAGVRGRIEAQALGSFHYLKRLKRDRTQLCVVDVYPLAVEQELSDWPESHERERVWLTPAEAASRVDEPELAALIEAFAALSEQ